MPSVHWFCGALSTLWLCVHDSVIGLSAAAQSSEAMNLRTFVIPLTILAFRSIDQNDPSVQDNVTLLFVVVTIGCVAAYVYIARKISAADDQAPLTYKDKQPFQSGEAPTVTTTNDAYDRGELRELFGKQVLIGLVIAVAVRYYWASLMPMAIQSLSIPMSIYNHNLFKVHVQGQPARNELARPWTKPNPFGDLLGGFGGGGGSADAKASDAKGKKRN